MEAIQDTGSSCQFEPEALVNAIKHIVEEHAMAQDGSQAPNNSGSPQHGLHANVQEAPHLGFHDL